MNTDSVSLSYVFIVLIMFSQHSKSIFMNLKPVISFVEQTLGAINKASQLTRASQDRKWIRARATSLTDLSTDVLSIDGPSPERLSAASILIHLERAVQSTKVLREPILITK